MCYKSRYVTVISAYKALYKAVLADKRSYHKQFAMHRKAMKCNAFKKK